MLISLIVALLATIAAAGTMPVHNVPRKKNNPPDNSTQPWQILNLYACYPYDLPGNYHDAVINVTIRDTNSIHAKTKKDLVYRFPPSLGTCSIRWKVRRANAPWGIEHSCVSNSIYSEWSLEMLKPWGASSNSRSATENFMLRFMLRDHGKAAGEDVVKVFEGAGHFRIGRNIQGLCATGICTTELIKTPFEIEQLERGMYASM